MQINEKMTNKFVRMIHTSTNTKDLKRELISTNKLHDGEIVNKWPRISSFLIKVKQQLIKSLPQQQRRPARKRRRLADGSIHSSKQEIDAESSSSDDESDTEEEYFPTARSIKKRPAQKRKRRQKKAEVKKEKISHLEQNVRNIASILKKRKKNKPRYGPNYKFAFYCESEFEKTELSTLKQVLTDSKHELLDDIEEAMSYSPKTVVIICNKTISSHVLNEYYDFWSNVKILPKSKLLMDLLKWDGTQKQLPTKSLFKWSKKDLDAHKPTPSTNIKKEVITNEDETEAEEEEQKHVDLLKNKNMWTSSTTGTRGNPQDQEHVDIQQNKRKMNSEPTSIWETQNSDPQELENMKRIVTNQTNFWLSNALIWRMLMNSIHLKLADNVTVVDFETVFYIRKQNGKRKRM